MGKPDPDPEFWALVEHHAGPVSQVRHAERGYSSDVTAVAEFAAGPLFLKAARETGRQASSLAREADINPYVRSVSPALRWRLHGQGWIILAFDAVSGEYADFTPGSRDLPAVAGAIDTIGAIECPGIARDWPETRWNRFTDKPAAFAGNALLYTDINPDNMLVRSDGVSVVDWSWPTRGAAFIDPACLVVQLVAAGHAPAEAEEWAQRCAAWKSADPAAVREFAAATVRMYEHFENRDPAPWRTAMTEAATAWAAYRGALRTSA